MWCLITWKRKQRFTEDEGKTKQGVERKRDKKSREKKRKKRKRMKKKGLQIHLIIRKIDIKKSYK